MMSDELTLETGFDPPTGAAMEVAPGVLRIVAPNAGPMTFRGTNTYLVGDRSLVIVDPGPRDDAHLAALETAIAGRPVEAILITHTHVDHTALAAQLASRTGAPILAEGPHRFARPLATGEHNPLDAASDRTLPIARHLADGEVLTFDAGPVMAVATPGHAANHLAFALPDKGVLLSGDHVMAWATTLVAPPDGSMADYMRSLEKLMGRPETLYLPGHGGAIDNPQPFLRGLRAHRRMRERAILGRLVAGDRSVADIVAAIYRTTDPRLHGAAALNVLSQLEYLAERGLAAADQAGGLHGAWRAA